MPDQTVKKSQCIIDVSIQHVGNLDDLFSDTGRSITDILEPGSKVPVTAEVNPDIVNYFAKNKITVAAADEPIHPEGLNYENLEFPNNPFTLI